MLLVVAVVHASLAPAQDYLTFPGVWVPFGSDGSDAWSLAWMHTWMDETNATRAVLTAAYQHVVNSAGWQTDAGGGSVLVPDALLNDVFPFGSIPTSSLVPMVRRRPLSLSVSSHFLALYSLDYTRVCVWYCGQLCNWV